MEHPRETDKSSKNQGHVGMSTLELTRSWLDRLEQIEGPVALPRKMKVAPGTIENFKRGRLKRWRDFSDAVRSYFVSALTKEIMRLNHELEMARECGRDLTEDETAQLRAAVAKARELIGEDT